MRQKIELAVLLLLLRPAFFITGKLTIAYGRRLPRNVDEHGRDTMTRAKLEPA